MTTTPRIDSLAQYHLLGRSGLRVSPLCLGTMTFGTEWGWGSPKETAHRILARYLEAGGNFLDTADGYTGGTSEQLIGEYFAQHGGRDGSRATFAPSTWRFRPRSPSAWMPPAAPSSSIRTTSSRRPSSPAACSREARRSGPSPRGSGRARAAGRSRFWSALTQMPSDTSPP
ncbi:aldo/keto reductase [Cystobacter fuscus]|uniref:aldo/keto reductase n=1 Tax=Cystobacter fuscus TaxID=43 RepID=UPI0009DD28BE